MQIKKATAIAIGQRFGQLAVIEQQPKRMFLCLCDCGKEKAVRKDHLINGATRSCGCLGDRLLKEGIRTVHGEAKRSGRSKEWFTWSRMIKRCTDPRDGAYARYGGRGIKVCQKWMESFESFLADMGRATSASHSIERNDNDGNYCPENCRWATKKEQANNRSTSHFLTLNGERLTASQWSERTGIQQMTILARVRKGWSEEKALTTPIIRSAA